MSDQVIGKIIRNYEMPGTRKYNRDGSGSFSYLGARVVNEKNQIRAYYLNGLAGINKSFPLSSVRGDWETWIREKAEEERDQENPRATPWYGADHYRWKWNRYLQEVQVARWLIFAIDSQGKQMNLFGGIQ